MAGEENKATQATAKSVGEWVGAFYGDDAIDLSKATKVKHLIATGQFASVVYVVTKNTKLSHTDLADTTYTAIDTMYAAAAELIIRLLHRKYKEGGRPLTAADFEDCGGKALFGKSPNYEQICNDYLKEGGMVDTAQKVLPVYESDEGTAKCYGRIVDDMTAVKRDHTYLLSITGSKNGTLSRDQIFNLYDATTDNSIKTWKKLKDTKSKGDFKLQEMMEDAYLLKYDLAKKSAKIGIVLGGFTYALGAMAGGLIFVPALVAIGSYALGKRWIPDWFKSAGAAWAGVEKRYQKRREIKRAMAHMDWLVRFVENGGKPKKNRTFKQVMSDMRFVRPEDVAALKKQGKTLGFTTVEGLDGNPIIGDTQRAKEAFNAAGALVNLDEKLVSPESAEELEKSIDGIAPEDATFNRFVQLANMIQKADNLPTEAKCQLQVKYAKKLEECVESLVFDTPMETMTRHQDIVTEALSPDGVILSTFKDYPGLGVTPKIMRCKTFASKELTGLVALEPNGEAKWKGKTLRDYIKRTGLEMQSYSSEGSTDPNYIIAIEAINHLERHQINENEVFAKVDIERRTTAPTISLHATLTLNQINDYISKIADGAQRSACAAALQDQMKVVFYNASRKDAQTTFNAITKGDFGGKMFNIDKFFEVLGTMKYENVDSSEFSTLIYDVTGETRITPQEVGSYLRGKLGKAAYDAFAIYIKTPQNIQKMAEDLPSLLEYLKKVGNCDFLNPYQKNDLISKVSPYISKAFDQDTLALVSTFGDNYSQKKYSDYLQTGYSKGGMKELFATDRSASVQEVKAKVEYLEGLSSEYECLKLGGNYKLNPSDELYIVKTLLTNRDDPDASYIRGKDDQLRVFMGNIKNSTGGSFGTIASVNDVLASQPYQQLEARLAEIESDFTAGSYDKYTALILLRGKAVALFRDCMKQLTSRDGERRAWLQANFPKVEAMRDIWGTLGEVDITTATGTTRYKKGILQRIDAAIAHTEFARLKETASGPAACSELDKYLSPADAEKVLNSLVQL